MERVEPSVYLMARPMLDSDGIGQFLTDLCGGDVAREAAFRLGVAVEESGSAGALVELMGRLCYRSFAPGLNPNVTKIREDHGEYIANILKSGHGSVLEHANFSFILHNVSRVLTHELVRHRAGMAYSQESLRYVRLDRLRAWLPSVLDGNDEVRERVESTLRDLEVVQRDLASLLEVESLSFAEKKKATSAMRRVAPLGLATTIGMTANVRALRHVIQMRTSRNAEEEIRMVFGKVAGLAAKAAPSLFQDAIREDVDGHDEWTFSAEKV